MSGSLPPLGPPRGFTDGCLEWGQSHQLLLDDLDPDPDSDLESVSDISTFIALWRTELERAAKPATPKPETATEQGITEQGTTGLGTVTDEDTTEPKTATEPAITKLETATEPGTTETQTTTKPTTTKPETTIQPWRPEPQTATEQGATEQRTVTEQGTTEPQTATEPVTTKRETAIGPERTEPREGEYDQPALPFFGPPGTPCDFTWERFMRPLSDWQARLEALYAPFSDEWWSPCTTEEWLYGLLHDRLVTRFVRQKIAPNEQEAQEIHVICILAKYYLIKREEMVKAHVPIYVELALSDAIIQLTMGEIDFSV